MKYVLSVAEWKKIEQECIDIDVNYDRFQNYILDGEFSINCSLMEQFEHFIAFIDI